MCKENDCGYHGSLFGGTMLSWLDEAAVSFACQTCETPRMVTVSMDKVEFLKPVRPGQIIKIYGQLLSFGRTSCILDIEASTFRLQKLKTASLLSMSPALMQRLCLVKKKQKSL